jgi:hypothetical protein
MRRITRLTTANSKKFEYHCRMIALHTVWYNLARVNSAVRMLPAMAAGRFGQFWQLRWQPDSQVAGRGTSAMLLRPSQTGNSRVSWG